MSCLDTTMETDKEKEFNIKSEKYATHVHLYGEKLELIKESKILNYNPTDFFLLNENYIIDQKKIYSPSLSPTEIYIGYEKKTGHKVAIKELKKEKLKDAFKKEMAKNELVIHDSIAKLCNNVVKVKDYSENEKSFYLIMEFCEEANYFEDMLENRYCPISDEKTLKAFAFDMLTALKEIHKNNIIHCDIKPQNFLLFKNENVNTSNGSAYAEDSYMEDYYLKITDFGYSHIIPEGSDKAYMKFPFGTFPYIAPEVTKNCYVDKSIDMWSFGVTLYQMAVAYFPTAIKQYKYGKGPIPFRACDWAAFDFAKVKDLIEQCLRIDPTERITVTEALNHPWLDE